MKYNGKKTKIISLLTVILLLAMSLVAALPVSAASVSIAKAHYSVQIGSTVKISATGSNITWSSSNTKVATVNSSGVVTGVAMGKATITAKSGSQSASCEITCGFYKGIDVSSWNGETYGTPVNWSKIKAQGIDFAVIRAGYGWEDYPNQNDNQFVANVKGCVQNDIPFGLYFYSYAETSADALKEANYLIKEINEYIPSYKDKITIPIAYDLEESWMYTMPSSQLTDIALTFCNKLQSAGYDAMVYGNTATFNNMNLSKLQSNNIGLWYAMWPNSPNFSTPETIGNTGIVPDIWQYASDGTVPGAGPVGGDVDMNVIYMLSSQTDLFKGTSTKAKISTPGSSKASVSWGSVSGASYNLYRAELDSSGKMISSTAKLVYSGSKTSYTDTTMQYGKAYSYYTDTSFAGDPLDPDYRKIVSGKSNAAAVCNIKYGDVDADGKLSLKDAILIQKYALKMNSLTYVQKFAADYDKSGSVDNKDALAVLKETV